MKADLTKLPQKKKGARAKGGGRKLSIGNEKDEEIAQWILEQRDLHIPVSRQAVQDYAARVCKESNPEFTASRGWLEKFLRRHSLSLRACTSMAQKLPGDLEQKVDSFTKYVKELRIEDEFDDEFIINMDETPVFFISFPARNIDTQETKCVTVRTSGSDK